VEALQDKKAVVRNSTAEKGKGPDNNPGKGWGFIFKTLQNIKFCIRSTCPRRDRDDAQIFLKIKNSFT